VPLVEVSIVAGRPPERVRDMIAAVHTAVHSTLGVPEETIRVIVREIPAEHWAVGGVTKAEAQQREAQRREGPGG